MIYLLVACLVTLSFCSQPERVVTFNLDTATARPDTLPQEKPQQPPEATMLSPAAVINTGLTDPIKLIAFARTLKGVPYKYASSDPGSGFDCSGFITYVFNHFGISVPRSSVDFTNQGFVVPVRNSRPGDLILFTGTDSLIKVVGHMGIITQHNRDSTVFIHATSGKAYSVTETPLNSYYQGRFMKVIRIFR